MVIIAKNVWWNRLKDKELIHIFFVGFNKRNVSDRQSFYYLFKRMNRDRNRYYDSDENDNGGRVYYDFKNGIYF
jgi:hypothetical protein